MRRTASFLTLLLASCALACLTACKEARMDTDAQTSSQSSDQVVVQPPTQIASQAPAQGANARVAFGIGLPAPNFTLRDIHGREVALSDHLGKVVVVSFWATWCGPCRMVMPHLQALSQQYPDEFAVLAISLDHDPQRVVPPFAAQLGLTFTLLADPWAMEVAQQWGGVTSIPKAYLVDSKGIVVEKWVGVKSRQEYEKRIRIALGQGT